MVLGGGGMRAAIICPTSMLRWVQEEFNPHLHLVLAQVYLQDREYADFFKARRVWGDDIILDQGAAELGAAIDEELIMKVAEDLRPTIVVAPDVIHNGFETVLRTGTFIEKYEAQLRSWGVKIMAVPQGENPAIYLSCFMLFNTSSKIDWLGISKFHPADFGNRAKLLSSLEEFVTKPCHLLGVGGLVSDLVEEREFEFAKANDTAKAIKLALQGLTLAEGDKRKPVKDYFGCTLPNQELVRQNIKEYLEVSNDY